MILPTGKSWQSEWIFHASVSGEDHPEDRIEVEDYFKPLPHDDPQQRKPDIRLAQEKLGWQPTILLDEGLDRMIDYFKMKYKL